MPISTSSSGSSISSGNNDVPILDAEEAGELLKLDSKTVDWLKKEPENDDNIILVLSYQTAFVNQEHFDFKKQIVSTCLTNSGATLVSDNVFKFDDWPMVYAIKDNIWMSIPWCFYHPHRGTAQQLNISQQPMITTTAITWLPETTGKLTIQPYELFKL